MELTTEEVLRRITETLPCTTARKLATIILNQILWKDGFNGLKRRTAASTLTHLAENIPALGSLTPETVSPINRITKVDHLPPRRWNG